MSDSGKAVFLSYASQDAEAVQRIAEALRATGIEVWFDRNELVGGDAWDQKIRRQIKECALFVPIISPNTNARPEGYFRLEWKLAVDRSHLMADDAPFLFPIALDGITDAKARVPEKFKEVQWTHLRLDETPSELAARLARLLAPEAAAAQSTVPAAPPGAKPAPPNRWQWWMIFPILGSVIGLLFAAGPLLRMFRGAPPKPVTTVSASPATKTATPAASEARRLADQAFALSVDKYDSTLDDYTTADALMKRAMTADGDDGEVLARSAQLQFMFRNRGFDFAPERITTGRTQAERAVRLAPESVEAHLALGLAHRYTGNAAAALEAYRRAVQLEPDHARALIWLGSRLVEQNDGEEGRKLLERARHSTEWAPLVDYYLFLVSFGNRKFADAETYIRRSFAARPSVNSAGGIALLHLTWTGDLEAAVRDLSAVPAAMLNAPRVVWMTAQVHLNRRAPEDALRALDRLPDLFIRDSWFTGPKALLIGRAHALAGRATAAKLAWEGGLRFVDDALKNDPAEPAIHRARGELLAALGRSDEALAEARTFEELSHGTLRGWNVSAAGIYATLGRADLAVPRLAAIIDADTGGWPLTRTLLRQDPRWDPIRDDPAFIALLTEPHAAADPTPILPVKPAIDDKSVAVLAFANLSDDKANEYFSDGISEELLNVLAKVPGLKVTARTSSFFFKGKETPIPEIAQKLGVAYVVEGSVRKAGDKVRITAQLIKAADGFHVWSDTFTRDLKDIFAVQDEIAGLIAQNLRAKMAASGERIAVAPDVYALILQARHAAAVQTNEGARQAIAFYQQAVARAPKSADAWAEMALNYVQLARFGGLATPEGMREARLAAQRALAVDPENLSGILALAWVQRTNDRDWRGAIASFRRALAVAPENVAAMSDAAICFLNVGLAAEAESLAARAAERDPLNPRAQWSLGAIFLWSGRAEQAVESYRKAVALAPLGDEYHSHLARALAIAGRIAEAKQESAREPNERYRLVAEATIHYLAGERAEGDRAVQAISDKFGDQMAGYLANICALAGRVDDAFQWLERGYEARDASIAWAKTNTSYESIRRDPRWEVFLRKMGLADDQLK
ncbi:MAG: TIR domain-containing protein [Candidatus Didemnitutus sp.]|nr:TIR domain-containing protein [Candidatus Didemnitutus sp.]